MEAIMDDTRRYALRETVQVEHDGGTHIGVIDSVEPGENLRKPLVGWAYHVRLPGHDTQRSRVVIVGEGKLRKLAD